MRALSRKKAYRKSTLRNLTTSLILYERIKTTTAKAKELKPVAEHLINAARSQDLTARRQLLSFLFDENAVKKVLEVLVPRFKSIKSGFIKTYKLGQRFGDNAEMSIIEFVKVKEKEDVNPSTTLGVKEKDAEKENRAPKTRKPARRNFSEGGTTIKTTPKVTK